MKVVPTQPDNKKPYLYTQKAVQHPTDTRLDARFSCLFRWARVAGHDDKEVN